MNQDTSPYYPRRARWYSPVFYLGLAACHRLALDRIRLPREITVGGIILGFLIPGLAIYIRGPRFWGKIALSACAFLFLLFIVWLGYPFANFAFGLMLSIHVTGFLYYCGPYCWSGHFRTASFLLCWFYRALDWVFICQSSTPFKLIG